MSNYLKKKKNDDLLKYKNEINEFREMFSLAKSDYSDDKLLEILKKTNFNYESSFEILFE